MGGSGIGFGVITVSLSHIPNPASLGFILAGLYLLYVLGFLELVPYRLLDVLASSCLLDSDESR